MLGPILHFKAGKFYITQTFSFSSQPHPLWPLHRFCSQMALPISWQRWTLVTLSLLSSLFMILMRKLYLCAETGGWLAEWRGQPHLNHMKWIYEKGSFYDQKTRLILLHVRRNNYCLTDWAGILVLPCLQTQLKHHFCLGLEKTCFGVELVVLPFSVFRPTDSNQNYTIGSPESPPSQMHISALLSFCNHMSQFLILNLCVYM